MDPARTGLAISDAAAIDNSAFSLRNAIRFNTGIASEQIRHERFLPVPDRNDSLIPPGEDDGQFHPPSWM
jgi:hypothetical protein